MFIYYLNIRVSLHKKRTISQERKLIKPQKKMRSVNYTKTTLKIHVTLQ